MTIFQEKDPERQFENNDHHLKDMQNIVSNGIILLTRYLQMINSDVVSCKLQLGQKEAIQQMIQRKLIADELKRLTVNKDKNFESIFVTKHKLGVHLRWY